LVQGTYTRLCFYKKQANGSWIFDHTLENLEGHLLKLKRITMAICGFIVHQQALIELNWIQASRKSFPINLSKVRSLETAPLIFVLSKIRYSSLAPKESSHIRTIPTISVG
jgi:hypothetical protein